MSRGETWHTYAHTGKKPQPHYSAERCAHTTSLSTDTHTNTEGATSQKLVLIKESLFSVLLAMARLYPAKQMPILITSLIHQRECTHNLPSCLHIKDLQLDDSTILRGTPVVSVPQRKYIRFKSALSQYWQ